MKKMIALVLTLALCLSLWIPAGAEEPETPALPTDQEIMDYALYFMTESQEDPSIVIRDFAHLTDGAGNPTGYYVSFNNEAGPAGYVLLSLISGENPIVEGAFEGGGLFDTEEAASLFAETQLAALGADCNGDGKVVVQLNQYLTAQNGSDSELAMYNYAANVKLLADLDARESYFFLLEDPEGFQADYKILQEDWVSVENGLYLARREFWEDRTAEYMEECDRLWERLVKEAS